MCKTKPTATNKKLKIIDEIELRERWKMIRNLCQNIAPSIEDLQIQIKQKEKTPK